MTTPGTQYALFESVEALPVEQAVQVPPARRFSDYVVYVDESGDHSLASIDRDYPVFVLALCIFHKRHYAEKIIPAVEKLKFNYFGHDSVVLHEHEIQGAGSNPYHIALASCLDTHPRKRKAPVNPPRLRRRPGTPNPLVRDHKVPKQRVLMTEIPHAF